MSAKGAFNSWMAEILAKDNPVFYSLEVRINRWLYQYYLNGKYKSTEILHEAYIRGIRYLDNGNRIENYSAWIKKVCLNVIREYSKKNRKVTFLDFQRQSFESFTLPPLTLLEFEESFLQINRAMQILLQQDPDAAELIDWRYQQNFTWEEIQILLQHKGIHCSLETLRQRGQRARKKLRQIYHDLFSPA